MGSPVRSALHRAAPPLAGALLLLATASPGASAAASERTPVPEPATSAPSAPPLAPVSPELPGLPPMSLALATVPVDGAQFRRAASAYDAAAVAHRGAQERRVAIDRSTTDLAQQVGTLRAELAAAEARLAAVTSRLEEVEAAIADLSVHLYVTGGSSARMEDALADEQPSINDSDRRAVLGNASMDVLVAEQMAYQARADEAVARIEAAASELQAVRAALDEATTARPTAMQEEAETGQVVAEARVAYEDSRVLATVEGVEFPLVALDAYYRAAATMGDERPGCGVEWWALAGISRVEGRHGTYGGSSLDARGDTTKRIIGIQLNGTRETAVVADTDDGALDGDPHFDRAVGPMQFIPQTWSRFASDGNADGVATPFNLYDATLAAARYLCRASGGLGADQGLRVAYFSYNHSDAYVEQVLAFARRYALVVDVPAPAD